MANASILCLAEGRGGSLWVGTKAGFSRLHEGDWESFDAATGFRKVRSARCTRIEKGACGWAQNTA